MRKMLGENDIRVFTGSDAKNWLNDLDPQELTNYYIWTFVRNPLSRVPSIMGYFQVTENEFCSKKYRYFEEAIQKSPRRLALHTLPSSFYTHINGKRYVDYIGKYERIDEDWQNLCGFLFKIPRAILSLSTAKT